MSNDKTLPGAIVFAAIAISGSIIYFASQAGVSDDDFNARVEDGIEAYIEKMQAEYYGEPAPAEGPTDGRELADDDAVEGDPDAPVTIVEFSDYECPYCAAFHSDVLPSIRANYIQTGKAKLVYRDYIVDGHPAAYPAALLAECVREDQGDEAYFQIHDRIFETIAGGYDEEALITYAETIGADRENVEECIAADTFREEIAADQLAGGKAGVTGTPNFFVNGTKIAGLTSYEEFARVIDQELELAQ